MLEKIITKVRMFIARIVNKQKDIVGSESKVETVNKGLILSNGVALSESINQDKELNLTDKMYLIIIMSNYNLENGYAELSIKDFLEATNTTNRKNVTNIIKRLEDKEAIIKLNGSNNEINKFIILKHMLKIEDNSVKIVTSYKNDTMNYGENDILIDSVNIKFKDITEELTVKATKEIIKETCRTNINILGDVVEGYKKLKNLSGDFVKSNEYNKD